MDPKAGSFRAAWPAQSRPYASYETGFRDKIADRPTSRIAFRRVRPGGPCDADRLSAPARRSSDPTPAEADNRQEESR